MEAGNRCFDQRVPEEINRRIVDHMADINLTYSSIARDYLLREGLPAEMVIKTGSPMFEVLNTYHDKIDKSDVLVSLGIKECNFFVVSAHREENVNSDKNFSNLIEVINLISDLYQLPMIFLLIQGTRSRIDETKVKLNPLIKLLKPLSFTDYNKLQMCAKAVLSDSGTITEEASILNFNALNLREVHERPEGMEEAVVIMTGLDKKRIMQSLSIIEDQSNCKLSSIRPVSDYNKPNVSEKILRIVHSYTDYVNRTIWKKY